MSTPKPFAIVLGILSLMLACNGIAWAAAPATAPPDASGSEAILMKIEALEKRVAELEEQLKAAGANPAPSEDVQQRLEKVEKAVAETPAPAPTDLQASWKDGLRFQTRDKKFQLRVGGRMQADWALFSQDESLEKALGNEDDGVEIRSARINFEGSIYENTEYRMEFDFAGDNGQARFKDVWIALNDLPAVGTLKVGHFREPFGLDTLTNPLYTTFMERGLPDAFAPSRNVGAMLTDAPLDGRMTWAVGAFKETDDFPGDGDSDSDQGYAVTARLTGLPWYEEEGRKLLHLGVAYSHRNPDGAVLNWRAQPESHLAMRYVNSEGVAGFRFADAIMDDVDLYGLEGALVYGPFSLQGEYMLAEVDTLLDGKDSFDGYYAQASYFLTGENRVYKNSDAVFSRVKPNHNFSLKDDERGWGAWELALRYSAIDLSDGSVRGGKQDDYTLGLNWHLNPNTRIMWNYIHAMVDHDLYEGDLDILQTRFQVDF